MNLWPHQERGVRETIAAVESGCPAVCLTSPTGGGKTLMMESLIRWGVETGRNPVLYTNRTLLLEQTSRSLSEVGIDHGIRASGYDCDESQPVQLAMLQTEHVRTFKRRSGTLHESRLVLVDEAHIQRGPMAESIWLAHQGQGATIVGVTATPVEIGHIYKQLVIAGTTSELRKCGALVACRTFGPDEPDLRKIKQQKTGEYSEGQIRKAIMTPTIFGRVHEWWKRLNPEARPAILFAPGVAESIWFVQQFAYRGVRAAHIDGESVYLDGHEYPSDRQAREDVLEGSRDGSIKVLCNRFVLREGINAPWLYHGIFATVFGGLSSYLQSGGRLLRAYPGLDHVVLQDHGGNWWRHGSLNADREWNLEDTNGKLASERGERIRANKEPEPIVCPKCGAVRNHGPSCATCGFAHQKRARMVIQEDGSLVKLGSAFPPKHVKKEADTAQKWKRTYYRCKHANMTFRQAEALFFREHGYWPPRDLPLMPVESLDWSRKVRDVNTSALNGAGN